MPEYISSDKEMSIQWNGFESKVEMMLYYVAVSEDDAATKVDCKQLVRYLRKIYICIKYFKTASEWLSNVNLGLSSICILFR